jgi:hypothetical protein
MILKPLFHAMHSRNIFWKCLFVLFIYFFPLNSWAQTSGSVEGIVVEDDSIRTPVPFANVFLSNTLIGITADDQGHFILPIVPNGKYTLTASSIGYTHNSIEIEVTGSNTTIEISLGMEATKLREVEVKWNRSEYARQLKTFNRLFLGTTVNAAQCEIENIADVNFVYDKEKKILTATCDKPIEIDNKALGYHVTYLLDLFKVDYKIGYCFMAGIPRFTNLATKSINQIAQWEKERNRAYYGSTNHFMRSLKSKQLKQNGFYVYALTHRLERGDEQPKQVLVNDSLYFQREVHEKDLLNTRKPEKYFLKIVYQNEQPEKGFIATKDIPFEEVSYLRYANPGLTVYENGYYEDALSYYLEGYISWSNKIADMVPMEYQPDDPQRSGTEPEEEAPEDMLLSDSAQLK